MYRIVLIFAAACLVTSATSLPASVKPCRDAHGKIMKCDKPKAPAAIRCKDARGKFVSCSTNKDNHAGSNNKH